MENIKRIELLSEILKSYAPNKESAKLVRLFTNKAETTENEVLIELVGAIYDGLAYGNWPWVLADMKVKA